MAYKPNIPQANDRVRLSQPELLENFQQILTVFEENHSAFNGATPGRHDAVVLVDQDIPPNADPATTATEFALYAKQSVRTGQLEMFTRRANNGTIYGITEKLAASPGWAMTSSGMLVQWGTQAGNGDTTFALPIAYPSIILGAWFSVITAGGDANRFVEYIGPVGLNQIRVWCGQRTGVNVAAATNFYWTTIGF